MADRYKRYACLKKEAAENKTEIKNKWETDPHRIRTGQGNLVFDFSSCFRLKNHPEPQAITNRGEGLKCLQTKAMRIRLIRLIGLIALAAFSCGQARPALALRPVQTVETGGGRAVGLELANAQSAGEVEKLKERVDGCDRQDRKQIKELIAQLVDFVCKEDRDKRRKAAQILSELSKDKFYEEIVRSIGGGKMVGLIRLIPFEQELDFIVPDFTIFTDDYDEAALREAFDRLEAGVYVLRSSSLFEDLDEFPLRKPYKSVFFVKSDDIEEDFKTFCHRYRSVLDSLIDRSWLSERKDKPFLEGDRMFVLLQAVPGHRETVKLTNLMGDVTLDDCYFPFLSGVTKHNPFKATNILSQVNVGLNTTVVEGTYRHYVNTDDNGITRISNEKFFGDVLSPSVALVSLERKTVVASFYCETKNKGDDELLTELQNKTVRLMLRLEEDFGHCGLEWSFDDGKLYIYQNTRSAVHKRMEELDMEMQDASEVDIAVQVRDVDKIFGHMVVYGRLVWIRPLPAPEGMIFSSKYRYLSKKTHGALQEFGEYILIGSRYHLVGEEDNPHEDLMGIFFRDWLGDIRGWVDTSGIEVAIGAHYADALIEKYIPVISTDGVDELKLEQFCPNTLKLTNLGYEVRYSDETFRMVVNALTGEGQVCLFKPARASAIGASVLVAQDLAPPNLGIERDL